MMEVARKNVAHLAKAAECEEKFGPTKKLNYTLLVAADNIG